MPVSTNASDVWGHKCLWPNSKSTSKGLPVTPGLCVIRCFETNGQSGTQRPTEGARQ